MWINIQSPASHHRELHSIKQCAIFLTTTSQRSTLPNLDRILNRHLVFSNFTVMFSESLASSASLHGQQG